MKKILCIFCLILSGCYVLAATSYEKIVLPKYNSVSCKFSQTKTIPNSVNVLKSGGNFRFNANSGVVFETIYPVKMTTYYTTDQNKRIKDIIIAVGKGDYSYLNRNFDINYLKSSTNWSLYLVPKQSSKAYGVLKNIKIEGSKYIDKININSSGRTEIIFTGCKAL